MAGVKGKSGGPRPNSGGARAGAGRPKKEVLAEKKPIPQEDKDMLQLLKDVALGRTEATALQVRAAIAAVQYTHMKKRDGGKKDEQAEAAKKARSGKFAAAEPPKTVRNVH